jgi:hypothetical protein
MTNSAFPGKPQEIESDDITKLSIPPEMERIETFRRSSAVVTTNDKERLLEEKEKFDVKHYYSGPIAEDRLTSGDAIEVVGPPGFQRKIYRWKS